MTVHDAVMRRLMVFLVIAACGDDGGVTTHDANTNGDAAIGACTPAPGWTAAPSLARGDTQETATVALDGKIYVLGGFGGAAENVPVLASVQIFDTVTCAWSMGPDLPRSVHHANAAVVDGRIYVVGAMEGLNFMAVGHVWSWNPATDTAWATHTSMPAGTQRGSAVTGVIGGTIYLAGGLRGGAVNQVSSYTPMTDTWDTTTLPVLPIVRDHGCGGVVDGKLYVTGGRATSIGSTSSSVYEYTPGGAWIPRMPMPTGRGGTACGVVGDRIIVVGGEGNGASPTGVFPQVESYQPSSDTWMMHAPMPMPRHGMGAAGWNGTLYVPGGADTQGFGAVATHEVFTP